MMDPDTDDGLKTWKGPLREMSTQIKRMESLVYDLLKLARLEAESGKASHDIVDVPALLEGVVESTRQLSLDKHTIELDLNSNLRLFGSEPELQSIFINLASNAVQYTPEGGSVNMTWDIRDDFAVFEVQDSGIGIEPEHLTRLTERFYRVDVARSRASGGTGLGLAIVKHALENHEGYLEISSEKDKGTKFSAFFPLHRTTQI